MFINLFGGYEYEIIQEPTNYTLVKTGDTGILLSEQTTEFINTLDDTTPTGIFFDLIPYILIIIFIIQREVLLLEVEGE